MRGISKLFCITFFILLTTGAVCFAQVKIKEEIILEPAKTHIGNSRKISSDTHSIKAVMEWDTTGGTYHYLRARLKISNICTNEIIISEYAYHGYAELIMSAETAGNYSIAALTESNYYPIDHSWFEFPFSHSLKVYADDQLVYTGSYNAAVDPWYGELELSLSGDELVCSDDKIFFDIGDKNCSSITGLKNDADVTLSILEGVDYSSFYDKVSGVNLGKSVTTLLSNTYNISLMLDSLYLGDKDTNIVVSVVSDWLNELDTISVISVKDISELKIYTDSYEGPPTDTGKTEYIDVYAEKGGHCDIPYEELPEETKYNVKITKGSDLGAIGYQPDGWEITQRGTELYNLDHNYGWLYLIFLSNVLTPTQRDTVIINVSTTDPALEPVDVMFYIQPDPLLAYADPNTVIAGDTARIIMKQFTDNGVFEDFPENAVFDIEIYDGYDYGSFYSSSVSDTSDYFYDTSGDFSFVAADSIDADSASVMIWVGTRIENDDGGVISGNIKSTGEEQSSTVYNESVDKTINKKQIIRTTKEQESIRRERKNQLTNSRKEKIKSYTKGKESGLSNIMSGYTYAETEFEIIVAKKKEQPIEILLGETKYLGVKKREEEGVIKEIKIEEIAVEVDTTPDFPATSDGWQWIKDKSIWAERPIDIQVKGESPIFYDWFWSKITPSGDLKPEINLLPDGMLRMVGRYLNKTEGNKVRMFTNTVESIISDTIEIKVIKPTKLGDGQTLTVIGPTKIDNVDRTYNIDSLLIEISGRLGILPQLLRAIIAKESSTYPISYRYEPYYDMNVVQKTYNSTHRYWIESENNLGDPTIPKHNNIHESSGPIDNYPGYITVWDIYSEKATLYNFNIPAYRGFKEKWTSFRVMWADSLLKKGLAKNVVEDSAQVLADTSYSKFLKFEIGGKGMYGVPAQTRISASYGLMQQVYACAVEAFNSSWELNYPNNNAQFLPEYLMIPDINIEYASKHYLGKLRLSLGSTVYTREDTWPKDHALELSYWSGLLKYNGGKDKTYPNSILGFLDNYLPTRK